MSKQEQIGKATETAAELAVSAPEAAPAEAAEAAQAEDAPAEP